MQLRLKLAYIFDRALVENKENITASKMQNKWLLKYMGQNITYSYIKYWIGLI